MTDRERRTLVMVAKEAIGAALFGTGQPLYEEVQTSQVPPYTDRRGCFVTLYRLGALRGCIGSVGPSAPLVDLVARLAHEAAFCDPRFRAVQPPEWESLRVEISILTEPRPISDPDEIVLGRDGVILTYGSQRALFLPQVATEQGWDRSQLLAHLALKAGLEVGIHHNRRCRLDVFQAEVFGDEPTL